MLTFPVPPTYLVLSTQLKNCPHIHQRTLHIKIILMSYSNNPKLVCIALNVISQKTTNKQHIGHKVGFFSDLVLLKMVRYITVFSYCTSCSFSPRKPQLLMVANLNLIGNVVKHACKQFHISLEFNGFKTLYSVRYLRIQ